MLAGMEAAARRCRLPRVSLTSTATARPFHLRRGDRSDGAPVPGFGITRGFPLAKRLD